MFKGICNFIIFLPGFIQYVYKTESYFHVNEDSEIVMSIF